MIKVLVLGEDTRSFLAVIRSLGRLGYHVDVVCFDNTSPSLHSRFIQRKFLFNYQAYTQEQWLEKVKTLIEHQKYDLVIPCDERAMFPLASIESTLPAKTKLGIPNQQVFEYLFDKHTTKALAQELDVPVAKGDVIKIKQYQYNDLTTQFGQRFVVKPLQSFTEQQLSTRSKVEIIRDKEHFNELTDHLNAEDTYLVEEYFDGVGEGVSLLAVNGRVHCLFAHTRVNEPLTGGGSSYRKAISVDPDMQRACEALCVATQYTGVGMFEFKRNTQSGRWILVEVNARFWGSLPLATYSGFDFPGLYARVLLNELSMNPQPDNRYPLNRYGRSFTADIYDIKKELEHYLHNKKVARALYSSTKRTLGFARNLFGTERIDSYSPDDGSPFKAELLQLYQGSIGHRRKLKKVINQNTELERLMTAIFRCDGRPSIKFVCYGNIMRSPFAHAYLEAICQYSQTPWDIESFGFHQKEGRGSPNICIETGQDFGIDLTKHESRWLRQEHLKDNDIVFIFDLSHESKLARYYQHDTVFSLASFVPHNIDELTEISDPYGKNRDKVRRCYSHIKVAIDNIFNYYRQIS